MSNNQQQRAKVVPAPFAKRIKKEEAAGRGKAQAADAGRMSKGRKRRWGIAVSWVLVVFLPTFLVGLYYFLFAADQYAVETRFAVRSSAPQLSGGLLSTLGLGLGGAGNDTYIILEYIHSREILHRIDKKIDLRKKFRRPSRDFYARLADDAAYEDFLKYWKSMVTVNVDRISRILTVKVYAFTADDARDIASAILEESERMVNELSERARADALAYAQREVASAEERLRSIRRKFLKFRSSTQQIDPAKQAQVQVVLIGKLEEQLTEIKTKLAEARSYLSENAPTIMFMKNKVAVLEDQIRKQKQKLGNKKFGKAGSSKGGSTLSTVLSDYEALMVEREFAEKLYVSALSGLEQARIMAGRQQRYLATFVKPYMPDKALYPKRIRNTIYVFLSLCLVWALGVLMVQSIRDRL